MRASSGPAGGSRWRKSHDGWDASLAHPQSSETVALTVLTVLAVTFVVVGTIWRLRYGVDFTDEAYYVAVPMHLVNGARPFIDEVVPEQLTTGILEYPLVRLYDALAGVTGIVLFVRWLQLLFSIAVAAVVVASLRGSLGAARATLVALAAILFVPYNIHSLSYNTVGCGLLTIALLAGYGAIQAGSARQLMLAGVCGGLAVFAYPPLAPAVVLAGGCWILLMRSRTSIASALLTLALPTAGFAVFALAVGAGHIVNDYLAAIKYTGQAGNISKLASVASDWVSNIAAAGHPFSLSSGLQIVSHYGWIAILVYPALRRRPEARQMLMLVWAPAVAAAVATSYSSANGEYAFAVGFFPATIATTASLIWLLDDIGCRAIFTTLPAIGLIVLLAASGLPVYRDGSVGTLTRTVPSGPFAGLATSPGKLAFIHNVQEDVGDLDPRCTILFFDDFPAGYLMTPATPDTDSVWSATVANSRVDSYRRELIDYYARRGLPDVAVVLHRVPDGAATVETYPPNDSLVSLIDRRYARQINRRDYTVFGLSNSMRCHVG